jgi:hypothetical protein
MDEFLAMRFIDLLISGRWATGQTFRFCMFGTGFAVLYKNTQL